MYDQNYASQVKRKRIENPESAECFLCIHYANSASEFEWPCLILKDWICEAHCTEVQMADYADTRQQIINLIGNKLDWKRESDLLDVCKGCPYSDKPVA